MESDVQQSKSIKDFDFSDALSEQNVSKIPRPSTKLGSPSKKKSKDFERPPSAKSLTTLENKFKSILTKYNSEYKQIELKNDKLSNLMEDMCKIRQEMHVKGHKDLPVLPDLPSTMSVPSFVSKAHSPIRTFSPKQKLKKLDESSCKLKNSNEEIATKSYSEAEAVSIINQEMPAIERTCKHLEDTLIEAHVKQNSLEATLKQYKFDITNMMSEFENVSMIKRNSECLIKELDKMKDEFQNERLLFRKEMESKDNDLKNLKTSLESEFSKRKYLEAEFAKTQSEKDLIKEECENYIRQLDSLQNIQALNSVSDNTKDLSIYCGHLKYEIDNLTNKLALSNKKLNMATEDNEKSRQEMLKLALEKEEIRNEFVNYFQETLCEKETQLYEIKSKMEAIVNLKNTMSSCEGRGEPLLNIDLLLNINDVNTLKKEVFNLHQQILFFEEARYNLERRLSTKDVKIQSLEEELSERMQTINKMEELIIMMKKSEMENNELLASLDLSSETKHVDEKFDDHFREEKLRQLIEWQDMQKETVAKLEKQLRCSEERYILSEERRVRNEERIALLQLKLAKHP